MDTHGREAIRFTLNGCQHILARVEVERSLADVAPDAIRKHAVLVNGTWFPAVQAFEIATGIPRSEFISHAARRHLAALGFEVAGDIESRSASPMPAPRPRHPLHLVARAECSQTAQGSGIPRPTFRPNS